MKEMNIKIPLCIKCINCKKGDNGIYCDNGHFENVSIKVVMLYSPFDFDCIEYDEV
jgi:hypothetical protein